MESNDRILITGGSGYIGRNLIKNLTYTGTEVYAIVRPSTNKKIFEKFNHIHVLEWDGSIESMIAIVGIAKPQIVIHLASLFLSQHQPENVPDIIQSNILLGTELLEACAFHKIRYFINTSSHFQNYNLESYNPLNLYAATKQSFEDILKYYTEVYDIKALTIKIIDTYGPFDPRGKIMSLFNKISRTGETLKMSPGEQELGLLYIDDVVHAFILALTKVRQIEKNKSFIAAPSRNYTLKEVAKIYENASEKKLNIIWGAKPYRSREMMKVWNREENILQGIEILSLLDGIKKMIQVESTGDIEL